MRALVIDDSKVLRRILRGILAEAGFEVAEAADGREALAVLRELGTADVALVDWQMPEMDGFAFIRAVRADPDLRALHLIMVTGENEPGQIAGALEAGADAYVVKPFDKETIRGQLTRLGIPTSLS